MYNGTINHQDQENKWNFTVSFDMGSQKRSSGRKYEFLSGHAFVVGVRCKKIVIHMVSSKMCATSLEAEHAKKQGASAARFPSKLQRELQGNGGRRRLGILQGTPLRIPRNHHPWAHRRGRRFLHVPTPPAQKWQSSQRRSTQQPAGAQMACRSYA